MSYGSIIGTIRGPVGAVFGGLLMTTPTSGSA
jgi:hypothetical protein